MTGTPVANRPYDLWAQIYFLDGGAALGTGILRLQARPRPHERSRVRPLQGRSLSARARGRLREDPAVHRAGNQRNRRYQACPRRNCGISRSNWSPASWKSTSASSKDMSAIVVRENQAVLDDAEEILKRLMRLVQVASNPHLVDDSYRAIPGKFPILLNLIHEAVDAGEKSSSGHRSPTTSTGWRASCRTSARSAFTASGASSTATSPSSASRPTRAAKSSSPRPPPRKKA